MSLAAEALPGATAVLLEARNLSHHYGPRQALEPMSFSLASPGVVAVTGPNGSGKSTLLRILAGLLRPTGGETRLSVAGVALDRLGRRRGVGLASPELAFYDELSAHENLAFSAAAHRLPDPERAATQALERVGLAARGGDRAAALSSGMKQRLRLAFAMLHRPALVLLDEPGTHLDDDGRALVADQVRDGGRSGLVILATNDEREWRLAERRIQLRGRGLGDPA